MTKQTHIEFSAMPWDCPRQGHQQKVILREKQKLRLLRFSDDFVEEHWCTNGHIGFVVDGEMTIDFNGSSSHYKKGDALWIESGEAEKHKVLIAKGKFVELILFEESD